MEYRLGLEDLPPEPNPITWEGSVERFAPLSPTEILALWHLQTDEPAFVEFMESLPRQSLDRTRAVYDAFANSTMPDARQWLGFGCVANLTLVDHDAGVALWDRLLRDTEPEVRNTAEELLRDIIDTVTHFTPITQRSSPQSAMRDLAHNAFDEAAFLLWSGLTRQDAYDLYLSYAYAENGQFQHDVGEAARAKLLAVQRPANQE